jgi:hypothetical protein
MAHADLDKINREKKEKDLRAKHERQSMVSLPVRLPRNLHMKFKIKCTQQRTTMQEFILNAVREFVNKG